MLGRRLLHPLAVVLLLAQMAFAMVTTAVQLSPTIDEPIYVATAEVYRQQHSLVYNPEHPPLAKLIMAAGLAFTDARLTMPAVKINQTTLARNLLYESGNNPFELMLAARLPIILLTLLFGLAVLFFARDIAGPWAGLIALTLYAFSPDVIAHGSLATLDVPAAGFVLVTFWMLWRARGRPRLYLPLAGVALGAALATRMNTLAVVPLVLLVALLAPFPRRRPKADIPAAATNPAAPTNPAALGEPTPPDEPAAPTNPAALGEPAPPGEPAAASDPAAPGEPAAPTNPAALGEPVPPGEPAAASDPAAPGEPAAPTDPAAPGEPAPPGEPGPFRDPAASSHPAAAGTAPVLIGAYTSASPGARTSLPRDAAGVQVAARSSLLALRSGAAWRGFGFRVIGAVGVGLIAVAVVWLVYLAVDPRLRWTTPATLPHPGGLKGLAVDLLPFPRAYRDGVLIQFVFESRTFNGFLLGEAYRGSKWYYLPIALLIKTPIGMLLLWLAGTITVLIKKWIAAVYLLLPAGLLMLVAMTGSRDYGTRYVIFAPMLLAVAAGTVVLIRRRWTWIPTAALIAFVAVSSLMTFPYYLPYSNEAFGGTANTHTNLHDSNVDWGQDLPRLADRLRTNYPDEPIWLVYKGAGVPSYYGIKGRNPLTVPVDQVHGLLVVSDSRVALAKNQLKRLIDTSTPIDQVGYSITIYRR